MRRLTLVALLLVAMAPGSPAFAHTGFGNLSGAGFGAGFVHPLGGLDHILAMVAVGLLGVRLGGRAIWGLPLTFLATMAVGALLGITGGYLRLVEIGIALSIIVFGALAALQRPMPLVAAMVIVGGFAIFHGHAHGAEAPATAAPALFALGFVLATGILHALGVAAGLANRPLMRAGGAAIAAIGTFVLVAG